MLSALVDLLPVMANHVTGNSQRPQLLMEVRVEQASEMQPTVCKLECNVMLSHADHFIAPAGNEVSYRSS